MMSEIESAYLEREQMQSTSLRDEYLQVIPYHYLDILFYAIHFLSMGLNYTSILF